MDAHEQQIRAALQSAQSMKAAHAPGSVEYNAAESAEAMALRQLQEFKRQDVAQAAAQRARPDYGYGGLGDEPIVCVAGDAPGQARIDPAMLGRPEGEPAPRIVIGGGGPVPNSQAAPRAAVVEPLPADPAPDSPPPAASPGPHPGPRPDPAPGIPPPSKKFLNFRDTGELVTWVAAIGTLGWTAWKFYKEIRR